jgi:hypothetical protein
MFFSCWSDGAITFSHLPIMTFGILKPRHLLAKRERAIHPGNHSLNPSPGPPPTPNDPLSSRRRRLTESLTTQ